jgi:hypothetical protein
MVSISWHFGAEGETLGAVWENLGLTQTCQMSRTCELWKRLQVMLPANSHNQVRIPHYKA